MKVQSQDREPAEKKKRLNFKLLCVRLVNIAFGGRQRLLWRGRDDTCVVRGMEDDGSGKGPIPVQLERQQRWNININSQTSRVLAENHVEQVWNANGHVHWHLVVVFGVVAVPRPLLLRGRRRCSIGRS